MVTRQFQAGRRREVQAESELTALGRALTDPERDSEVEAPAEVGAEVELTMADLVSDDQGEIVFFNDSGFRTLGLTSDARVTASGRAPQHVTAGGADVTGFKFVTFDNGLTLYYDSAIDLVLNRRDETR